MKKLAMMAALALTLVSCGGGSETAANGGDVATDEAPTTAQSTDPTSAEGGDTETDAVPTEDTETDAVPTESEAVSIAILPGLLINLPIWVAEDQGFFEDRGVDAEILNIQGGGAQAVAALLGGSADLTYATVQQTAIANQEGQPLRLVVGNHTAQPYALIVAKEMEEPASGTAYPEVMQALEGKRIAITTLGSDSHLKLQALLEGAGMTEDDVQVLQSATSPVPGFVSESYDAMLTIEPIISQLTVGLDEARIVMDLRKEGGNAPTDLQQLVYNGWVSTEDRAQEDRVYRASQAIADAIEFIRDSENMPVLEELAAERLEGQSPEVIESQLQNSLEGFGVEFDPERVALTLESLDLEQDFTYEDLIVGVAAGE